MAKIPKSLVTSFLWHKYSWAAANKTVCQIKLANLQGTTRYFAVVAAIE